MAEDLAYGMEGLAVRKKNMRSKPGRQKKKNERLEKTAKWIARLKSGQPFKEGSPNNGIVSFLEQNLSFKLALADDKESLLKLDFAAGKRLSRRMIQMLR